MIARRETPAHPLVLGRPVPHRWQKQAAWIGMSVLLGAGFIAGAYWLGLQQHYPWGSAKLWWDNGMGVIRSGRWAAYRHGVRDGGEPASWTLVGATLLGRARSGERLLPLWAVNVIASVVLLLVLAGTVGITWLTAFGPWSHVNDTASWQQLLLGVVLGRLLHFIWAPAGGTVRYHLIARSAYGTRVPLWVRWPLLPPVWQEQWQNLREAHRGEEAPAGESGLSARLLIPVGVFLFLVIAVVGDLAKFAVAHGVHVPGMTT